MSELREQVEGDIQRRLRWSSRTHKGLIIGSLLFGFGMGIDGLDSRSGDAGAIALIEGVAAAGIAGLEKAAAKRKCDSLIATYRQRTNGGSPYYATEIATLGQGFHCYQEFDSAAVHMRAVKNAPMYSSLGPSMAGLGSYAVCALLPANEIAKLRPELSLVFGGLGVVSVITTIKVTEHLNQVDAAMAQTYHTQLNNIDQGFAFGSGSAPEGG